MGRTAFMVLSIFSTAVMLCSCGGSRQRSTSSDEDQIRAVLQQSIEAWNRGDVEAFAQTYCAEKRERRIVELKSMGPNDQRYGVGKITVNGDRAQAVITLPQGVAGSEGGKTGSFDLVFDNGQWLVCE